MVLGITVPGKRIAIGLPVYRQLPAEFFKSFAHFSDYMYKNYSPAMIIIDNLFVQMARQQILELFLESDCSHLLFLDSDMVFPLDIADRLIEKNENFISALYFSRNDPEFPVFRYHDMGGVAKTVDYPEGQIFRVDSVGLGCCLIKRDVVDKVVADNLGNRLFETPMLDEKRYMGEDIYFCNLVRKSGFEIKVDSSTIVGHVGGIVDEKTHKAAREDFLKRNAPP